MQKTATCRSGFLSLRTLVALLFCATITCFIVIPTGSGLAFLRPEKPSNASQRTLTFEERVSYQLGNHIIPHALGQRGQQKISQRTSYAPSHADGGAWTVTGSLNTGRFLHTVTSLPNGMVLVAGGLDNNFQATASTELYDPGSGTWTATGNLNTARYEQTATLLPNGQVLVAGDQSSRAGFYLVVVGGEVLKFMGHAILAFFHRAARAKAHAANHLESGF